MNNLIAAPSQINASCLVNDPFHEEKFVLNAPN